jgi:hypothetical protein
MREQLGVILLIPLNTVYEQDSPTNNEFVRGTYMCHLLLFGSGERGESGERALTQWRACPHPTQALGDIEPLVSRMSGRWWHQHLPTATPELERANTYLTPILLRVDPPHRPIDPAPPIVACAAILVPLP